MKKHSKGPKTFKTKLKSKENNLPDDNIDKISNNIEKDIHNKPNINAINNVSEML